MPTKRSKRITLLEQSFKCLFFEVFVQLIFEFFKISNNDTYIYLGKCYVPTCVHKKLKFLPLDIKLFVSCYSEKSSDEILYRFFT